LIEQIWFLAAGLPGLRVSARVSTTRLELFPQPCPDVIRLVQPSLTANILTHLQAGHLDLTTAGLKRGTVLRVMLGISGFNVQTQPGNFFAYLDAERAGSELVKGKILAGLVDAGLLFSAAGNARGRAELFAEQHEWRQNKAQGAEKITDNGSHG
jgi:hypothetical protein